MLVSVVLVSVMLVSAVCVDAMNRVSTKSRQSICAFGARDSRCPCRDAIHRVSGKEYTCYECDNALLRRAGRTCDEVGCSSVGRVDVLRVGVQLSSVRWVGVRQDGVRRVGVRQVWRRDASRLYWLCILV